MEIVLPLWLFLLIVFASWLAAVYLAAKEMKKLLEHFVVKENEKGIEDQYNKTS